MTTCSYIRTGRWGTNQKKFHCKTCGLMGDMGICEVCARKCHTGHNVVEVSSLAHFGCDCGAECSKQPCKCIPNNSCCTLGRIGKNSSTQHVWGCKTCGLSGSQGVCNQCAERCHKGHQLIDQGCWNQFSCSCGTSKVQGPCMCKTGPSSPIDAQTRSEKPADDDEIDLNSLKYSQTAYGKRLTLEKLRKAKDLDVSGTQNFEVHEKSSKPEKPEPVVMRGKIPGKKQHVSFVNLQKKN